MFVCAFILLEPSTASTGRAGWGCCSRTWRTSELEVKRSKVQGGNGTGERAGMGWDQREGKAKETGELRKLGRYLGDDGGAAGPELPQ